jgi:hypothetical protein
MPISFPDTNPETYFQVFDDFVYPASATASDVMTWTSIDDSGTGTNAFQDVAGGYYNIVTAAADNDYHAMRSVNKVFVFAAGKPIWIDCRFKVSEATLLESTWWIGLNDTTTTGGFQANTSGPLASFTGALIYKTPETALTVNAVVSAAAVQSIIQAFATSVSNTVSRVQLYWDGISSIVPHFFNGTSWAQGPTLPFTAGTTAMYLIAGIKAGPTAAAETLQIDYIRAMQTR